MKRAGCWTLWRTVGLWAFVALIQTAHADSVRVTCPEGLKWVFEGYCKKDFNVAKDNACPQRSKKAQPNIPGPIICYAKGVCPEGTQPTAKGFCVKPGEK